MKILQYKIQINAPIKKVWHAMLEDKTYREWTAVFMPGSYYDGNWEVGSTIKFLAPDENGTVNGMISMIAENRPYEFISIRHIGEVKNGIEDTKSDDALKWTGAFENYTFKENDNRTELTVEININEDWEEIFEGMWPKALQKLKELTETL